MGIVALTLNGVGFYSYNFSADECATYHLAPNLTKSKAVFRIFSDGHQCRRPDLTS
jgi:hypothetical protein